MHMRYEKNPGTQCEVRGKSEYYTQNQNNWKTIFVMRELGEKLVSEYKYFRIKQ